MLPVAATRRSARRNFGSGRGYHPPEVARQMRRAKANPDNYFRGDFRPPISNPPVNSPPGGPPANTNRPPFMKPPGPPRPPFGAPPGWLKWLRIGGRLAGPIGIVLFLLELYEMWSAPSGGEVLWGVCGPLDLGPSRTLAGNTNYCSNSAWRYLSNIPSYKAHSHPTTGEPGWATNYFEWVDNRTWGSKKLVSPSVCYWFPDGETDPGPPGPGVLLPPPYEDLPSKPPGWVWNPIPDAMPILQPAPFPQPAPVRSPAIPYPFPQAPVRGSPTAPPRAPARSKRPKRIVMEFPPNKPPKIGVETGWPQPPERNEKERKVESEDYARRLWMGVAALYGSIDEARQALDCVHSALPSKHRKGDRTAGEKIKSIVDHFEAADVEKAAECILLNWIEDRFLGRLQKNPNPKRDPFGGPRQPYNASIGEVLRDMGYFTGV